MVDSMQTPVITVGNKITRTPNKAASIDAVRTTGRLGTMSTLKPTTRLRTLMMVSALNVPLQPCMRVMPPAGAKRPTPQTGKIAQGIKNNKSDSTIITKDHMRYGFITFSRSH
jgi:hypothetical protein